MEIANSKANTKKNIDTVQLKDLENKIKNNSASNNFFIKTTDEESLNLNDNTVENFIKSIISSGSVINEMANMKNVYEKIPVNDDDVGDVSNMFNDDSFNEVLKEKIHDKNLIQAPKIQMLENKSKNNIYSKQQIEKIELLNVKPAAKLQVMNIDIKSNF